MRYDKKATDAGIKCVENAAIQKGKERVPDNEKAYMEKETEARVGNPPQAINVDGPRVINAITSEIFQSLMKVFMAKKYVPQNMYPANITEFKALKPVI